MRALWVGVALSACASAEPRSDAVGGADAAACELTGEARVVLDEGDPHAPGARRLVVWDLADDPVLWSTARPQSATLDRFIAAARERVGDISAEALLGRVAATLESPREVALNQRLLAERARMVVPMRCFDALFIARQIERMDMISTPTEVLVFVLVSHEGAQLRLVEYTVNQPGIGRVGPPMAEVERAIEAGYRLRAVFHNHNFFFGEDGSWRGGSVAPSAPDAELLVSQHASLGLGESWISNGFSTSLIPLTTPWLRADPDH